jgi:Zn-dependent protease/CBS domain-containing protein
LLFACVVIHELSHSRMAQHYGAEVESITLLPIGGLSLLKKMPDEPRKEMWVSLVGPASNVVIAALLAVVLLVVPGYLQYGTAQEFFDVLISISVRGLITYLLFINLMLAIFNLLPAFPLDGGRVLRSILAQRMSYARATRAAVLAGQAFAFMLGLAGLLLGAWIWIFIAVFIYLGASQEGSQSEVKDVLSRLKVADAVTGQVRVLSPQETLGDVASFMLHSLQEDFPVVQDGRLVGILTRAHLVRGLRDLGPAGLTNEAMEREFPTVAPDAPFSEVYEKINQARIKAVPVVDDGRLLGMVTLEHLSEVFMLMTTSDKSFITRD